MPDDTVCTYSSSSGGCKVQGGFLEDLTGISQVSAHQVNLSGHQLPVTIISLCLAGSKDGVRDAREQGTVVEVDRAGGIEQVPGEGG